jgi:arylsulfatase A-like enzyme
MARLVRRRTFPTLGLLALVAGAALAWGGSSGERPRNILLISVDTLSRGSLRAFDPEAEPLAHLDRFAREARRFDNAHSTAPWTLPSTASLMTGLYPDRHGAIHRNQHIDRDVPTLAQRLRSAGFETVGLTEGGFVHGSFGFGTGFDRYDERALSRKGRSIRLPRGGRPTQIPGERLFDRARAYLKQRKAEDAPFFLFLQTYAVHDYFRAHDWAAQELSHLELRDAEHYSACLVGEIPCSAEDRAALLELYRLEVRRLDAAFGTLMKILEQKGLRDSTLVVVLSDHGEGFGFQRFHHGGRLHEDQIGVPLLVSGPGVVPGVTTEPVSLVDVMPTLLAMTGVGAPNDLDGESFASALRDLRAPTQRTLFAMDHSFWWEQGKRFETEEAGAQPISLAVIRSGDWYIRGPASEELYQTVADPRQRHDLVAASPALPVLRDLAASRRVHEPEVVVAEVRPQLQGQLEALGYVR